MNRGASASWSVTWPLQSARRAPPVPANERIASARGRPLAELFPPTRRRGGDVRHASRAIPPTCSLRSPRNPQRSAESCHSVTGAVATRMAARRASATRRRTFCVRPSLSMPCGSWRRHRALAPSTRPTSPDCASHVLCRAADARGAARPRRLLGPPSSAAPPPVRRRGGGRVGAQGRSPSRSTQLLGKRAACSSPAALGYRRGYVSPGPPRQRDIAAGARLCGVAPERMAASTAAARLFHRRRGLRRRLAALATCRRRVDAAQARRSAGSPRHDPRSAMVAGRGASPPTHEATGGRVVAKEGGGLRPGGAGRCRSGCAHGSDGGGAGRDGRGAACCAYWLAVRRGSRRSPPSPPASPTPAARRRRGGPDLELKRSSVGGAGARLLSEPSPDRTGPPKLVPSRVVCAAPPALRRRTAPPFRKCSGFGY